MGGGRDGGSPVAQYHNGHLVNRIDFTTGQRWRSELCNSNLIFFTAGRSILGQLPAKGSLLWRKANWSILFHFQLLLWKKVNGSLSFWNFTFPMEFYLLLWDFTFFFRYPKFYSSQLCDDNGSKLCNFTKIGLLLQTKHWGQKSKLLTQLPHDQVNQSSSSWSSSSSSSSPSWSSIMISSSAAAARKHQLYWILCGWIGGLPQIQWWVVG